MEDEKRVKINIFLETVKALLDHDDRAEAWGRLNPNEQIVLERRANKTQVEVGRSLGRSARTVGRLEQSGLAKLRQPVQ